MKLSSFIRIMDDFYRENGDVELDLVDAEVALTAIDTEDLFTVFCYIDDSLDVDDVEDLEDLVDVDAIKIKSYGAFLEMFDLREGREPGESFFDLGAIDLNDDFEDNDVQNY